MREDAPEPRVLREPVVLLECHAREGCEAQAHGALLALADTVVRAEPDCLEVRVLRDPVRPSRFLLMQRWSDGSAYGQHQHKPYAQALVAACQQYLAAPPCEAAWDCVARRSVGLR